MDLSTFNPPQQEAIQHINGPMLVLAGAGSGKTRVLTYRIAYLVEECGINPSSILAVTFTNKAAKEMKERLHQILQGVDPLPLVSTFHSFCARVLREEIEVLGYRGTFTILDDDDVKKVLLDAVNTLNLDSKKYKPQVVAAFIDSCKNDGLLPQEVRVGDDYFKLNCKKIYKEYQARLKTMNALDFGDLIMYTLKIFQSHSDILAKYHRRFKYFLTDESQDTNGVQYDLIKLIASQTRNLCIIGDDDQSIYAFRGADLNNILSLEKDYPDIKTVRLEQNYRCTKTILAAANSVIAHNKERMGKTLFTDNKHGDPVTLATLENEKHEGQYIAREILNNKRVLKRKYSDHVVLYRVNALSRSVEEAMLKNGIPYQVVGGLRFFDRAEIKDALAYLRLIANPADDMALRRIINTPARGIGKTTIDKLSQFAVGTGRSMLESIAHYETPGSKKDTAAEKLKSFSRLIEQFVERSKSLQLHEFVNDVLQRSGYFSELEKERTEQAENRIENLQELVSVAVDYTDDEDGGNPLPAHDLLNGFLERIALISSMDSANEQDCVTLMTMHASKGLEFPVVFVAGAEDGLFPHQRSFESKKEMEEERRLAYVAITRAKEKLHLCMTEVRTVYGKAEWRSPSLFLSEIPDHCVSYTGGSPC
ncbi:exodeoxyribonuclease V subunit gamma (plasmid) [Trichlorobacter lovleyi]|uniref:ATP-dependent helicase n=1 Tax=Trichlorobacter lovleyi TaxID=313985 RepID=UPI00223F9AB7|nr:UvrD-helicase domain-containing protein [Trichlorobacter lovleyi]QOX80813.1 exodeoxyribonuclease V subunit gamma [Trichlorobacter lovleyi]